MEQPLVSIIIPCLNREKLIRETLDSIIAQTYFNWEVLVIDDGSTDNTLNVVANYTETDNRIRLYKRNIQLKGASVCRNIGIENARGNYAIFLDSDDLLLPFCLEQRVFYMSSHPELDFGVFQMLSFDSNGIIKDSNLLKEKENYLYAYLRHDLPWAITCPIWKVSFIRKYLIGYNDKYPRLQDPEFNTRALLVEGSKFQVLLKADADCLYRTHTDKSFNTQALLIGFDLYLNDFLQKTKNRFDHIICRENLKGCYIEAIRCFYTYKKNGYDRENAKMIKQITRFSFKQKLISYKTVWLTALLKLAYLLRIDQLAGGKFLLRFNMKLIKTIK